MPEELVNFDGHLDPTASQQYFQAHHTFPPTVTADETMESVQDRVLALKRIFETSFVDVDGVQITHEISFLEDSIRKIGKITLKG